jgi:O-antigen/teichoic acid export membrane protein
MLMAFQSVIMLIVLTHVVGLIDAGIFTIAYANANLLLTIGKYGMRNFQVSDSLREYSFGEYKTSRIITSLMMMLIAMSLILYLTVHNGYSPEKTMTLIIMCVFKLVDAVEDVYHGLYQQCGRLDVAGKCLTLRMVITIIVFCVCLTLLHDLLAALTIATIITAFLAFVLITTTYGAFTEYTIDRGWKLKKIMKLLLACFPLFIGMFMSLYIGNAPKYAIDYLLDDQMQACYGFISMPVFIVSLLGGFIFNPMIADISERWNAGDTLVFKKKILRQLMYIMIILAVCLLGGYFFGLPVLSFIYNTDLDPYLTELLILLASGGFVAVSVLFVIAVTIIRYQTAVAVIYAFISALAFILSPIFVARYSLMGAAVLYFILTGIQCLLFALLLWLGVRRHKIVRT